MHICEKSHDKRFTSGLRITGSLQRRFAAEWLGHFISRYPDFLCNLGIHIFIRRRTLYEDCAKSKGELSDDHSN